MSSFLLDTNTISLMMRGDAGVDAAVRAAEERGDLLILSPLVEFEIRRGLLRRGAIRTTELVEELREDLDYRAFDEETWRFGAELWARAHDDGRPLPDADVLIAAHSLQHGAVLVTANTQHFTYFEHLGLVIENWKAE